MSTPTTCSLCGQVFPIDQCVRDADGYCYCRDCQFSRAGQAGAELAGPKGRGETRRRPPGNNSGHQIAVATDGESVVLNFIGSGYTFTFSPDCARRIAESLVKMADATESQKRAEAEASR